MAAAGAVLLLGFAAACGSSEEPAATSDTGTNPMAAYTACLKEQGIDIGEGFGPGGGGTRPSGRPSGMPTDRPTAMPSGGPGGGFPGGGMNLPEGVSAEDFQKAQQACADKMPSGFGGRPGGGRGSGNDAAYTNCLTENGVQLAQGQQPDASDPTVAKAMEACAVLRPNAAASPTA